MTYTIRVHEPARDSQVWRTCTHRVDADSWFSLAAEQFQPDTEIRLMIAGRILARVVVMTPFVVVEREAA